MVVIINKKVGGIKMIDHVSINTKDIEKCKKFYKEVMAPLNNEIKLDFGDAINIGSKEHDGGPLWIAQGDPAPVHIAFNASSKEEVMAFYTAGLKAGGTDNGAPGIRAQYGENYYAAFIIDLDGNNIEAVYYVE